jgi:transcriptional regulator with XRE-family HTH domain
MIPNKEYILKLTRRKRWSYAELARQSGVSPTTICRWIKGDRGAGRCLITGFLKAFPEQKIEKLFFLP